MLPSHRNFIDLSEAIQNLRLVLLHGLIEGAHRESFWL